MITPWLYDYDFRLARQVYHMLGLFVFGSMVTLLLTDTTKAVR